MRYSKHLKDVEHCKSSLLYRWCTHKSEKTWLLKLVAVVVLRQLIILLDLLHSYYLLLAFVIYCKEISYKKNLKFIREVITSKARLIKESLSSSTYDILIALGYLFVFSFWGITWA